MPNGFGRGRAYGRGFGAGMGFGFRGASPPWPYVGRGRGGLPRCSYPGAFVAPLYAPGPVPYSPPMTQEQEIDLLRSQAEAIKRELDQVEARMHDLEAGK